MRHQVTWIFLAAGVLRLGASAAVANDNNALALNARALLKQHCHRCHHGQGSEGGDFDVLRDKTLTAAAAGADAYVVAGKPDESYLFERVIEGSMPPRSIKERPTTQEIAILRQWIQAGAPPYPQTLGRPFVGTKVVLGALLADLHRADPEDRRFLRYFTLTHLYNNPNVPDGDLRVYRAALSKAVNSLSWKPGIVLPRAVDKAGTVFVVDLRDLDWDRDDLWLEVIRGYPYALRYKDHPDGELHRLDHEIVRLTGCELPLVRADWFVATATQPPLYHLLLRLPKDVRDLEKKLDVDVEKNFLRDRLWRAGFFPSGVSGQNRLVERHDARYGSYWKSYDFKKDNDRSDLQRFPLGPKFKDNKFTDQAFVADGGEIIFHLPNGLQGYLLIDAEGKRLDIPAPVDVVSDSLKTFGTPEIVNGLSCMACHKHGMITTLRDNVRHAPAVYGPAHRKVLRLYPKHERMAKLLAGDQKRFMGALEEAIGPILRVGAEKEKPLTAFAEPIGEIARLYALAPLDLTAAASELGLPKPQELLIKIGEKRLRELRLGSWNHGGSIDRRFWETGRGVSLFQRAARELGATPFRYYRP